MIHSSKIKKFRLLEICLDMFYTIPRFLAYCKKNRSPFFDILDYSFCKRPQKKQSEAIYENIINYFAFYSFDAFLLRPETTLSYTPYLIWSALLVYLLILLLPLSYWLIFFQIYSYLFYLYTATLFTLHCNINRSTYFYMILQSNKVIVIFT